MKTFTEKRFQPLHELGPDTKNSLVGKIKDYLLQNKDIVFACVHGSFIKSDKFRDIDIAVFTNLIWNISSLILRPGGSMEVKTLSGKCPLCGGIKKEGKTTFTVDLGFGVVVVRDVPATVCSQCGADWIGDAVAAKLEEIVNDARKKHPYRRSDNIIGIKHPIPASFIYKGRGNKAVVFSDLST